MLTPARRRGFRAALLAWFRAHAREMPWRSDPQPYHVWLSEIMLQQTRVETARPYYARFLTAFPTVQQLAAAPVERVLELWQGLGYYTRARSLHRAAQLVVRERAGVFPRTPAAWAELPGIGRYTAGAIASIACGEAAPLVDGNVKRVFARLFAHAAPLNTPASETQMWTWAEVLLDRKSPGDFNQALMELGARVCTPRKPACAECPVQRWCVAHASRRVDELPLRRAKRKSPVVRMAALCVERGDDVLLVQRPPGGLLGGLWTLPSAELLDAEETAAALSRLRKALRADLGVGLRAMRKSGVVDHTFTHRQWHVEVFRARAIHALRPLRSTAHETSAVRWLPQSELPSHLVASVDRKLLATAFGNAQ